MPYAQYFQKEDGQRIAAAALLAALAFFGWGLTLFAPNSSIKNQISAGSGQNALVAVPQVPNTGADTAPQAEARVTFVFEGGFESAYLIAVPIFDKAKQSAVIHFNPHYVGYGGYVNQAQLTYAKKRGHQIVEGVLTPALDATVVRVGASTTLKELEKSIDAAKKENDWLVIVFRRIDEVRTHDGTNASHELVQGALRYAIQKEMKIATESEAVRLSGEI